MLMDQIQLNKVTQSIEKGKVANTYLLVGNKGASGLEGAINLIKSILRSPYAGLDIPLQQKAIEKLQNCSHPDIHYIYPVNTTSEIKKNPKSSDFIQHWRELTQKNFDFELKDWYEKIGLGNKQGAINKDEAEKIAKTAHLKSYEGGVKIFVIWMAEKLNISAANKLLKLLEEPPERTVFILVCNNEKSLLKTIISRCQKINLFSQSVDNQGFEDENEVVFVEWVRAAFKVKSKKEAINDLVAFSEAMSKKTREQQKQFLSYCSVVFQDSILHSYKIKNRENKYINGLDLKKFAPFVHEENILDFYNEVQKGYEDIERNGNPRIIFLDISIKLTRLLHKKKTEYA